MNPDISGTHFPDFKRTRIYDLISKVFWDFPLCRVQGTPVHPGTPVTKKGCLKVSIHPTQNFKPWPGNVLEKVWREPWRHEMLSNISTIGTAASTEHAEPRVEDAAWHLEVSMKSMGSLAKLAVRFQHESDRI